MNRYGIAALAALTMAGAAPAADFTPTEIVNRHMGAGGNIDAIMQDYADDAIIVHSDYATQGKPAIRKLFEKFFPPQPAGAPAAPGNPPKIIRVWEEGNVGFVSYQRGTGYAADAFVVRNGKIQVQIIYTNLAAPAAK